MFVCSSFSVCVCLPSLTYRRVCESPSTVFSRVVAEEEDGGGVAVGVDDSWRSIATERTEITGACFNL